MRKVLASMLVAGAVGVVGAASALAMPVNAPAVRDAAQAASPVEQVRLFCYNRYTGRFLHWGPCQASVPRVYCRRHYTDSSRYRFLHWGACRGYE